MKTIALMLVAASLVMGGCGPLGMPSLPTLPGSSGTASTPITSGDILAKAKQVQAYAVTACKYEPYIASVISLFNAGVGATVGAVGEAICQAATSVPLADGGPRAIKVQNITVQGRFVR